jgi:hypothetical protein
VELGNDANDTCAMLSEACRGSYEKFKSGINSSKWVAKTWKLMKEVVIHDENVEKVQNMLHSDRRLSIRTILCN